MKSAVVRAARAAQDEGGQMLALRPEARATDVEMRRHIISLYIEDAMP